MLCQQKLAELNDNIYYEQLSPRLSQESEMDLMMTPWSREQLVELNLDAFLTLYKENEFPLELGRHLSLDQCEALIPDGPGGWRKVSSVLMCLVK